MWPHGGSANDAAAHWKAHELVEGPNKCRGQALDEKGQGKSAAVGGGTGAKDGGWHDLAGTGQPEDKVQEEEGKEEEKEEKEEESQKDQGARVEGHQQDRSPRSDWPPGRLWSAQKTHARPNQGPHRSA